MKYHQGDIVEVNFLFPNGELKVHPALIVSNDELYENEEFFYLCLISSKNYNSLTKYCTNSGYGTVDNKIVLEAAADAATANWGGSWRMPTKAEQDELLYNCTWTWTIDYQGISGLNGYVVSATNGNSIFLPAAGYRYDSSLYYDGDYGYYWSASLSEYYSNCACLFYFTSDGPGASYTDRLQGFSVRPVCQ